VRRLVTTLLVLALAGSGAGCGGSSDDGGSAASTAPTATSAPSATALPVLDVAQTAACQSEAQTIVAAEAMWVTLHGEVATLDQLVAGQFLRTRPAYHRGIRAGVPAGGYTVVGVPGKCGNWPVADAGH
jgi:hypothetical protein